MRAERPRHIYSYRLDQIESINRELLDGFLDKKDRDHVRRSHYFEGRYENIYIPDEDIPAIGKIKDTARELCAEITGKPAQTLRAGLWFNAMEPGQVTLPHRHDDYDEIMSAVYYVTVPENSGKLILSDGRFSTGVTPEAGLFVLFPPDMLHEVTRNESDSMRLSLGINIGPAGSD